MMTEYKILEKQDLEFLEEVIEDDGMKFDLKKLNEFYENPNTISFVAKENNRVVGFVYGYDILHPNGKHAYFIYSVGVLPEYQNKGIGTELLKFVKDYIRANGFFEIFVLADKENKRACHVYEKIGGKNEHDDEVCYVVGLEN